MTGSVIASQWKADGPLSADERREAVESLLASYPRLSRLLQRRFPSLIRFARATGLDDDEIEAESLYAVVLAARIYDPSTGRPFRNHAFQRVRKEVAAAANRRARERQCGEVNEHFAAKGSAGDLGDAVPPRLREFAEAVVAGEPANSLQRRYGWGRERQLRRELETYLQRNDL